MDWLPGSALAGEESYSLGLDYEELSASALQASLLDVDVDGLDKDAYHSLFNKDGDVENDGEGDGDSGDEAEEEQDGMDDNYDAELEYLTQAYVKDSQYQSRKQAIGQMIYSILNACFIALPYACYEIGIPAFVFIIVLLACVSAYTSTMVIAIASEQSQASKWQHTGANYDYLTEHETREARNSIASRTSLGATDYERTGSVVSQTSGNTPAGSRRPSLSSSIMNNLDNDLPRTLEELSERAYGYTGYVIVSLVTLLLSTNLMMMSIGVWSEVQASIGHNYLHDTSLWHHAHESTSHIASRVCIWLLTTRSGGVFTGSGILLPIILSSSTLVSLDWTSYTMILLIVTAICTVIAATINNLDENSSSIQNENVDIAGTISTPKTYWYHVCFVMMFTFAATQKSFVLYNSLRRRTLKRWKYVVNRSYSAITLLYLVFGVLGYISHLSKQSKLNYLLIFDGENDILFDVLRGFMALCLLLTFPTDCLTAAMTIRRLVRKIRSHNNNLVEESSKYRAVLNKKSQGNSAGNNEASSLIDKKGTSASVSASDTHPIPENKNTMVDNSSVQTQPTHSSNNSWKGKGRVVNESELLNEDDESQTRHERNSSVADVLFPALNENKRPVMLCSTYPIAYHVLPTLFIWALVIGISFILGAGVALAAMLGGFCASILVFLLPACLYFKLGLRKDFQDSPFLELSFPREITILPNQFYMYMTILLGSLFFVGNIAMIIVIAVYGPRGEVANYHNEST